MAALPIAPPTSQNRGALQVAGLAATNAAEAQQKEAQAASQTVTPEEETGLAGIIRRDWDIFQRHRNTVAGWSLRLLSALRQFNGQYDPEKLAQIRQFGGSEIYARLTAVKCRGASSLLRDVYLNEDRPWGLVAPADPEIPLSVFSDITTAVQSEIQNQVANGEPPPSKDDVRDRTLGLIEAARQTAKKKAQQQVEIAEDKIQTLLDEGGYYTALGECLTDIPIFPFTCLKGPVVKMQPIVQWRNGTPFSDVQPRLTWARVSPFDIWFTPGVADIANATVIERLRLTRASINDLLDLPGYNHTAIKEVLTFYGRGYTEAPDFTDAQRAVLESRENPTMNESWLIDCLEYHGNVQGDVLLQAGMDKKLIPDPMRDYAIEAWLIGRYVIKLQLSPSPRKRHPYFITSWEKVPGTPVGNALPDTIGDLQDAANASLRSIVNNMAMASGPQVVVFDDRLSGMENGEQIFPWKRWHVVSDPMGNSSTSVKPVDFFQPQANFQENWAVFQGIYGLADDISAIPRYLQGSAPGGAGRTASGLAMLMGNASKVLQTVCSNIDTDIIAPSLQGLLDIVLLTDTTDILDGTEKIVVKGVQVAMQRETQRSRQMEFLQGTMNPIDLQIMGPAGRAAVLREVAKGLGIPGEKIVPSDDDLKAQQDAAKNLAQQNGQPGHALAPPGAPNGAAQAQGSQPSPPNMDMGPRTNLLQRPPVPAGGVGGSP
jgi:hypothetical protein